MEKKLIIRSGFLGLGIPGKKANILGNTEKMSLLGFFTGNEGVQYFDIQVHTEGRDFRLIFEWDERKRKPQRVDENGKVAPHVFQAAFREAASAFLKLRTKGQ